MSCEQALRGALAVGWEKEGELVITSPEFEYLHRKSRCEMLIAGDDISNDVITLSTCFSMFVFIRTRFRFTLISGNLTAQPTRSYRGIGGGIQIPGRDVVTSSRSFSRPPLKRPGELARRLVSFLSNYPSKR